MPRGNKKENKTGIWLREYFRDKKSVTPYQAFKDYRDAYPDYRTGSAHTMETLFFLLSKKLNLIEKIGEIINQGTGRKINIYRAKRNALRSKAWEDLFAPYRQKRNI